VTNKGDDNYERYGESRIHDRSGKMERMATVIHGREFGLGRFQLKAITYHLAPLSDSISMGLYVGKRANANIEAKTELHAWGGESKTAGGGALT
jgi:hypothetical protein